MSIASLIFSLRVQSQLADANLGAKGLNALFGVLNPVRVTSLELALLGGRRQRRAPTASSTWTSESWACPLPRRALISPP